MREAVINGPGVERFVELGKGCRRNGRAWLSGVKKEYREASLGLSETVTHHSLVEGDAVCLSPEGKIIPLMKGRPFAGFIQKVFQNNRGEYMAQLTVRGIFSAKIEGFSRDTRQGATVYAKIEKDGNAVLTVEAAGVPVGEICLFETSSKAVVGVRLESDPRRYYTGSVNAARTAPRA
jgi:hypothetical protein